jgi:hypothetical protein
MKLRLINHALLKRKPVFSSFSSSLFLVSPSYSSPPNTMQVRKTRRGKPEGLGWRRSHNKKTKLELVE